MAFQTRFESCATRLSKKNDDDDDDDDDDVGVEIKRISDTKRELKCAKLESSESGKLAEFQRLANLTDGSFSHLSNRNVILFHRKRVTLL